MRQRHMRTEKAKSCPTSDVGISEVAHIPMWTTSDQMAHYSNTTLYCMFAHRRSEPIASSRWLIDIIADLYPTLARTMILIEGLVRLSN